MHASLNVSDACVFNILATTTNVACQLAMLESDSRTLAAVCGAGQLEASLSPFGGQTLCMSQMPLQQQQQQPHSQQQQRHSQQQQQHYSSQQQQQQHASTAAAAAIHQGVDLGFMPWSLPASSMHAMSGVTSLPGFMGRPPQSNDSASAWGPAAAVTGGAGLFWSNAYSMAAEQPGATAAATAAATMSAGFANYSAAMHFNPEGWLPSHRHPNADVSGNSSVPGTAMLAMQVMYKCKQMFFNSVACIVT